MNIIVQKFGGTSVATPEGRQRVSEKVIEALNKGLSPVVVVSAMGRHPQAYATDTLLSLVGAYQPYQDKRELDLLMACGETISAVIMSHHLRSLGYQAEAFDAYRAGIRCSDDPGEGAVLKVVPDNMLTSLRAGNIPVVTGFQGVNSQLAVTTLGRGGSDTSAVVLGAALKAQGVENYTDVDGVMTADPRVCDQAHILSQVSFEEMGELAGEGAKVVHPRAVDLAADHNLPVWIKNTFGEAYGTLLSPVPPPQAIEKTRVVTAVAHMLGLSQAMIDFEGHPVDASRNLVMEAMAQREVNLDLINLCGPQMYFIFRTQPYQEKARQALDQLGFPYHLRDDCAKISLVGAGMRGTPGVAYRAHRCLSAAGVEVYHSTDSNITISCLIPAIRLRQAMEAVHREFNL
ncbi:aspartate kinase [bacterium]|nr:aspartate kinase [bacterium]